MTEQTPLTHVLKFPRYLPENALPSDCISWGNGHIDSAPHADPIAGDEKLFITSVRSEPESVYIQLRRPHNNQTAPYVVRSIHVRRNGDILLVLGMPDTWPIQSQVNERYLVQLIDEQSVTTLLESDFLKLASEIDPEVPVSESLLKTAFRPVLSTLSAAGWKQAREHACAENSRRNKQPKCLECTCEVRPDDDHCSACGVKRVAPLCTQCGQHVSRYKDEFHDWNSYSWNCGWDGTCESCGFLYASRLTVRTGHSSHFGQQELAQIMRLIVEGKVDPEDKELWAGTSVINLTMGDSLYVETDAWDYQPTIVIHIRRRTGGDDEQYEGGALRKEAEVALTPSEWHAIREEMDTKLGVLLARKRWTRDTT